MLEPNALVWRSNVLRIMVGCVLSRADGEIQMSRNLNKFLASVES